VIELGIPRNIACTLFCDQTNIELCERLLSLFPQSYLLIEDEFSLFVRLHLLGERMAGLFEGHFTGKFYFHFDCDKGEYELKYFLFFVLGHLSDRSNVIV
jgi:hypothetical protein